MTEAMKMQKMKMMMNLHKNSNESSTESDFKQHNSKSDLPFKLLPHPLLPVNLPRTSVALVMNQMSHLNTLANMVSTAQVYSPNSRPLSVIKKECSEDVPLLPSTVDGRAVYRAEYSHTERSSPSSSPKHANTHSTQCTSLNTPEEQRNKESGCIRFNTDTAEKCPVTVSLHSAPAIVPGFPAAFLYTDGSSVETLLTNVQGLLKVALENARVQDKQLQQERRELKMELYREREIRESLERQLNTELHSRATIQRRLRKEKKAKKRLQEALEFECKRREEVEQALQHTASHIFTQDNTGGVGLNVEVEHTRAPWESTTLQERNG